MKNLTINKKNVYDFSNQNSDEYKFFRLLFKNPRKTITPSNNLRGDKDEYKFFKPLKANPRKKRIASFDIETHGSENKFVMGSYAYKQEGITKYFVYWNKREMIDAMLTDKTLQHNDTIIFAHNLYFDYTSLFENEKEFYNSKILNIGTRFIQCLLPIKDKKYLKFYDTLNHIKMSLQKAGELINIPKLEHPSFLGEKPVDKAEEKILEEYNIRDTEICLELAEWLQTNYNEMGGNIKMTSPSTSLDVYRRKYMTDTMKQPPYDMIQKIRESYYGGRTEVLKRGKVKNLYYYDVNSMYPYVMKKYSYPDTRYIYECKGSMNKIFKYEGVSLVKVKCPYLEIPYLPYRLNGKLIFPYGEWTARYTHFELRNATNKGYEIEPIETIYYTKTNKPFENYIEDIYNKRINTEDRSLSLFYKLLMNSLYGKWGQNPDRGYKIENFQKMTREKFEWIKQNSKTWAIHYNGQWIEYRLSKGIEEYSNFINPILSSYVTAYARDILYKALDKNTYYMDTDSIITSEKLPSNIIGEELGKWKIEDFIIDGILIKPKWYVINGKVKIKGVRNNSLEATYQLLKGDSIESDRMTTFKESLNKGISFNTMTLQKKTLSKEDDKREWGEQFNEDKLQSSKPLKINE